MATKVPMAYKFHWQQMFQWITKFQWQAMATKSNKLIPRGFGFICNMGLFTFHRNFEIELEKKLTCAFSIALTP